MEITRWRFVCVLCCTSLFGCGDGQSRLSSESAAIPGQHLPWGAPVMPQVGDSTLLVISPTLLEIGLITTKEREQPFREWNFVNAQGRLTLPQRGVLEVLVDGKPSEVKQLGFKRRVWYAPLKKRDLRTANYLYVELMAPIPEGSRVEVKNPGESLWRSNRTMRVEVTPQRWTPVLHVNQTGYLPSQKKLAMVGYYAGSLGELDLKKALGSATGNELEFAIIAEDGREAFRGRLTPRPDEGFPYSAYEKVWEADFTALTNAGEYRLSVRGLGVSFPFLINDGVAAALARTYALGLYHQRCGTSNRLPYTRFTHKECHTRNAEVPDNSDRFRVANESLAKESANYRDNPKHSAPQLRSFAASLYPFVNRGSVVTKGGHHDAGDYSKYTINSAGFIHHLLFAADAFPGVSDLDNLGLPESGDGKSDVIQEVKWEADFLCKMQDQDGGFYFLVYPRDREYESDVLPDKGDPQIVFPKTTSATAAAVAALAQCAGSRAFQKQFPEVTPAYLEAARRGWKFLEAAFQKHGEDGSYQKITHYGDEFMHQDEVTWAACELFLATGDETFHSTLKERLKPASPELRRWGWLRLYEAYGSAIRSYAFGARSGRLQQSRLDTRLLEQCEQEIAAAGQDQLRRARESAYGTSFPTETKRAFSAGWYFSGDAAFDLAVACQLPYPELADPRAEMRAAILSNLNYEQGCNPVNVCYLTGLGSKRQREIVHQYAQNDRRTLPLSGIPLGNIQGGFGWNYVYEKELDLISFPSDGDQQRPYPFYDRWGDGFNLTQEFVILNQGRALGYLCWLMAQTPLREQKWSGAEASVQTVANKTVLQLQCSSLDLTEARVTWEAEGVEPQYGREFMLPSGAKPRWVEAEAVLPDGRRVFASREF